MNFVSTALETVSKRKRPVTRGKYADWFAEGGRVLERVTGDEQEVGDLVGLYSPDVGQTRKIGAFRAGCAQCPIRRRTPLDELEHLPVNASVNAIGPKRDPNAG